MDPREKTEQNIARHGLLEAKRPALVGVSGGVDSMVLLHLLKSLAPNHGWRLHVAHFNHQLRGGESDADEQFVAERARTLGLPFVAGRGDVLALAGETGISIEMAGRKLRHGFFAKAAREMENARIVLAHHADDQVETFWMRLLRGDVGRGLGGMRWKAPSPAGDGLLLVRPLLDLSKAEILTWAREHAIAYREDSSNAQLEFQRNRLRREILPLLEKFQPELRALSLRTARALAAEKEFLHEQALAWLDEMKPPFGALHEALQREIIRTHLIKMGANPTFDLVEALRAEPETAITLAPNQVVWRDPAGKISTGLGAPPEFQRDKRQLDLTAPGQQVFHHLRFAWRTLHQRGAPGANTEFFDAGRVGSTVKLRFWGPGDRFRPIGMPGSAKLQDLFMNLKVPAGERRRRAVAETAEGNIFWVEGLRMAEDFKVTEQTATVLEWRWMRTALNLQPVEAPKSQSG